MDATLIRAGGPSDRWEAIDRGPGRAAEQSAAHSTRHHAAPFADRPSTAAVGRCVPSRESVVKNNHEGKKARLSFSWVGGACRTFRCPLVRCCMPTPGQDSSPRKTV